MKYYAAQMKGGPFTDLLDEKGQPRGGYAELCEVQPGCQAHKREPRPIAWGYFDTRREALRALEFNDFPSEWKVEHPEE